MGKKNEFGEDKMRKRKMILALTMLAVLSLAACHKKAAESTDAAAVTSAAATEAAGTSAAAAQTAEPSSAPISDNTVYATVQSLKGNVLKVEMEDGRAMSFDVSDAKLNPAYPLALGDEIEIVFQGSEPIDGMAVTQVNMMTPFEMTSETYNEDGNLWGQVTAMDENSITVLEDNTFSTAKGDVGEPQSYTLKLAPYRQVISASELKVGTNAYFNYTGELGRDALVYRICTEDMQEAPESEIYAMTGTVEKIEDNVAYLNVSGTSFKFSLPEEELAKLHQGSVQTIQYYGSIRSRVLNGEAVLS